MDDREFIAGRAGHQYITTLVISEDDWSKNPNVSEFRPFVWSKQPSYPIHITEIYLRNANMLGHSYIEIASVYSQNLVSDIFRGEWAPSGWFPVVTQTLQISWRLTANRPYDIALKIRGSHEY